MGKIMIVGTGNVGSSIAYALLNQRTPVKEIILTDLNMEDAEGEAMDLADALAVSPSFVKLSAGTYTEAKDCDIVVITAGANQKPGESRRDLIDRNAGILRSIVEPIRASGFDGIYLVVSNPVDALSYLTWNLSGLAPERVIGSGTVLDSARLRFLLSEKLGVHPKSVHAYMIGEHGDSEFAFWSAATAGGERIMDLLSENEMKRCESTVRDKAYQIIQKKGATHYGIGACVVQIINCILNDEHRILPVSTLDDNTGVFSAYPAIIGRSGVVRRLSAKLTEIEGIKFQRSANAIKRTIKEVHEA